MLWWTKRKLRSKDSDTRELAADELIVAHKLSPFADALKDRNRDVRLTAVQALSRIGHADRGDYVWRAIALQPLVAALKDAEDDVRAEAAAALGEAADDVRIAGPLQVALKDKSERVRAAAAASFNKCTWELLHNAIRVQNWDEVVSFGVTAVEPLLQRVAYWDYENYNAREGAKRGLRRIGAAAVMPLTDKLKTGDEKIRSAAAEMLGELGDARAVEPLVAALTDKDSRVRSVAAQSLKKNWAKQVEPALADYERFQEEEHRREKEAERLNVQANARAQISELLARLTHADSDVRKAAAKALGDTGDARAVEPLIGALRDENWRVSEPAAASLGRLGKVAVEPLLAALKDENEHVRYGAALALGTIKDARAVEALTAVLQNEKTDFVRATAAEALSKIGDARSLEPLLAALKDTDRNTRTEAAKGLGVIGAPSSAEALTVALQDEWPAVRDAAAEALKRLGIAGTTIRRAASVGMLDKITSLKTVDQNQWLAENAASIGPLEPGSTMWEKSASTAENAAELVMGQIGQFSLSFENRGSGLIVEARFASTGNLAFKYVVLRTPGPYLVYMAWAH